MHPSSICNYCQQNIRSTQTFYIIVLELFKKVKLFSTSCFNVFLTSLIVWFWDGISNTNTIERSLSGLKYMVDFYCIRDWQTPLFSHTYVLLVRRKTLNSECFFSNTYFRGVKHCEFWVFFTTVVLIFVVFIGSMKPRKWVQNEITKDTNNMKGYLQGQRSTNISVYANWQQQK